MLNHKILKNREKRKRLQYTQSFSDAKSKHNQIGYWVGAYNLRILQGRNFEREEKEPNSVNPVLKPEKVKNWDIKDKNLRRET